MKMLSPEEAIKTFGEVARGYTREEAVAEARRAAGAGLAEAHAACPFGIDIRQFVHQIAEEDFDGALGTIMDKHPWPRILGRWCQFDCEHVPHDLGPDVESLAIGPLERAASEYGDFSKYPFQPGPPTGKRVAIIGAGSASSAAAYRLRQRGHHVAVYEQLPVTGGMMFAGYPEFRLPVAILRHDNALEAWGVEVHCNVRVDTALLERLLAEYDAVLLGTGKFKGVPMNIPGEDLEGVWDALTWLTEFKLGNNPPAGPRVVVLGAGYTAQDSSRTCRRLGHQVQILYRRSKEEMPVAPYMRDRFVGRQAAEGAPYVFETTAIRVLGENGRVVGLECVRTRPGPIDESGRPSAVPIPGSNFELACDTVIMATGEIVDVSFLPADVELKNAHPVVDERGMTTRERLFAAGEMTGISSTMRAFANGFQTATNVDRYLREQA